MSSKLTMTLNYFICAVILFSMDSVKAEDYGPSQCHNDHDCGHGFWCASHSDGNSFCKRYAGFGESCNAYTLPEYFDICDPSIHKCYEPQNCVIADIGGTCVNKDMRNKIGDCCWDDDMCETGYCASGESYIGTLKKICQAQPHPVPSPPVHSPINDYGYLHPHYSYSRCSSDRPGWPDHRTLYVPKNLITGDPIEQRWVDALCCVYTHVEILTDNIVDNKATFELYDGSSYKIFGLNFEHIASSAYHDLCDINLGKTDCDTKDICVYNALYSANPTPPPTSKPSIQPTKKPSSQPSKSPSSKPSKSPSSSPTAICSSDRPGWASHRTLYVPEHYGVGHEPGDSDWIDALCCIYTHIEIIPGSYVPDDHNNKAILELYDGSIKKLSRPTFQLLASAVYDDICEMTMGAADCRNQHLCVQHALDYDVPHTLPKCFSDRPGWGSHRTLYVPRAMIIGIPNEDSWTRALCCVYTHVELVSTTSNNRASLELYDGSTKDYWTAHTFEELASHVYGDICSMPMGSSDCHNKAKCVDHAF